MVHSTCSISRRLMHHVLFCGLLLVCGQVLATPVTVLNPSFEDFDTANASSTAQDWTQLEWHVNGIMTIDNAATIHDTTWGEQFAAVSNRGATGSNVTQLTQMIYDGSSTGLAADTTYTLSMELMRSTEYGGSLGTDYRVGLYEDATMSTPLAQKNGTELGVLTDVWGLYTITFDSALADAGKALYIGVENSDPAHGNYSRLLVDDVQLDATAIASQHPGDANGDGMVNLADLQILGDNWQSTTASWAQADFTGDGNVNLADLQILGDNWGYGVSPDVTFDDAVALTGVVIPEPATAGLLGMALLGLVLRRRTGQG